MNKKSMSFTPIQQLEELVKIKGRFTVHILRQFGKICEKHEDPVKILLMPEKFRKDLKSWNLENSVWGCIDIHYIEGLQFSMLFANISGDDKLLSSGHLEKLDNTFVKMV